MNAPANYHAYLRSPAWRRRVAEAKRRAGYRCNRCHSDRRLEAHHKTYARFGNEHPGDIEILCHACHQKETKKLRAQRNNQRRVNRLVRTVIKVIARAIR